MKSGFGFLRVYLLSVVIIGLIGLADALLTFLKIAPALYVRIVSLLLFLFFFFNVFSLAAFRRHQLPKIVYVLPIYHLVSYIVFLSLALYLTIIAVIPSWLSYTLIGLQLISSLFELSFSIYLLTRSESYQAL